MCSPNYFSGLRTRLHFLARMRQVKDYVSGSHQWQVDGNHVSLPVQGCQVWVCLFHAHALLSSRLEVKDSRTVEQPISLSYHPDKALSK